MFSALIPIPDCCRHLLLLLSCFSGAANGSCSLGRACCLGTSSPSAVLLGVSAVIHCLHVKQRHLINRMCLCLARHCMLLMPLCLSTPFHIDVLPVTHDLSHCPQAPLRRPRSCLQTACCWTAHASQRRLCSRASPHPRGRYLPVSLTPLSSSTSRWWVACLILGRMHRRDGLGVLWSVRFKIREKQLLCMVLPNSLPFPH